MKMEKSLKPKAYKLTIDVRVKEKRLFNRRVTNL